VVSDSQISEVLRIYNLIQNLSISNPDVKVVSANGSLDLTVCLVGGGDRDLLEEKVNTYLTYGTDVAS
jgi:hypothetical protein